MKCSQEHDLIKKEEKDQARDEQQEQQAFIFGTLFVAANKLQVIGDAFDQNITIKQWLFLVAVAQFKEPPTVSEIADFVGYSRQNAKRLAATLEENGFVRIDKDKKDARALRIELTPKFFTYFDRRRERELEFIEKLFHGFTPEKTAGLYQGLIRLTQNIEILEKEMRERNEFKSE